MLSVLTGLFASVDVVVASRDPAAASNMPALSVAEQEAAVLSLPATVARGRLHFVETDAEVAQPNPNPLTRTLTLTLTLTPTLTLPTLTFTLTLTFYP